MTSLRLQQSDSWGLLQFLLNDPLADAAEELSQILEISVEAAQTMVTDVLDYYHYKTKLQPKFINYSLNGFIVHLTQPYRIPEMTSRFDWYINILKLEDMAFIKNALDYGGGGGKDSILLARRGIEVTYCDFLSPMTEFVAKRFELRKLDVKLIDARDLTDERFDLINCMDVIEHVYDLEAVLSDLSARLKNNGILFIVPAFYNSWNGDHVEKNCAYKSWFPKLAETAGLRLIGQYDENTYCFIRAPRELIPVEAEKSVIVKKLYERSRDISLEVALAALTAFSETKSLDWNRLDDIADNLAVFRLSSKRLS